MYIRYRVIQKIWYWVLFTWIYQRVFGRYRKFFHLHLYRHKFFVRLFFSSPPFITNFWWQNTINNKIIHTSSIMKCNAWGSRKEYAIIKDMKKYNQLSQRERDLIDVLSRKGESCVAIGKKLKRDKSTIARELKHNSSPEYHCYLAHRANQRAKERRS